MLVVLCRSDEISKENNFKKNVQFGAMVAELLVPASGSLNEMAPLGSRIGMLGPSWWNRLRRIRKRGRV